ncbi:MAG: hypothetical protein Q7I93_06030 [Syntrophales bacterium]|nr:hypothetical protein [Syntrophales bacterium]
MNEIKNICYLCGQKLEQDVDRDHVPPKQFYPSNIRKKHNPNLLTLPVHKSCNKSYQGDEDYFVHSIAPLTKGSYSGNEIWQDISNQFKRPQGQRIGEMILKEFESRPSGLYLPSGQVAKRFDPERIWRVVWKMTRGLFFKEHSRYLLDDTPNHYSIISVGEKLPPEFEVVRNTPSRGQYPGVFDYKFVTIPELNKFHFWAMLFWDRLIILIAFHDPDCSCDKCSGNETYV